MSNNKIKLRKGHWILISGINSALGELERNHKWNLSVGEHASLIESFFDSLHSKVGPDVPEDINFWPQNNKEWRDIFEKAYINTWGKDHTCNKTSNAEIETFLIGISDSIPGDWVKYMKKLGLMKKIV